MSTPNEDLLRLVRSNNYYGNPRTEELHNALEGILDELDAALDELKVLRNHLDAASEETESTKEITWKLREAIIEASESLDRLESQLINR